jgi:nucleotide-binding universal stress UspA family protein
MDRILIAVDSSHNAKSALDYVMTNIDHERLQIHLLNVQRPIATGEISHFQTASMISAARHAAGEEVLRPLAALLEAEGIDHVCRVVLGEPALCIARYAASEACTSIVMSTRARSAIGKVVLGSVATKVIHVTDLPVTLVKQTGSGVPALLQVAPAEERAARRFRRMQTQDVIQGS